MKRRTRKKGYRKYNLFEATYTGYKRRFANAKKAGILLEGETMMTKEEFYSAAIGNGASYTDKEGVIRFDPAKLRRMASQAVATATGTITEEQARRLKGKLIILHKEGHDLPSLAGRDVASIKISELRASKKLLGEIHRELKAANWSKDEIDELISEIFGS